MSCTRLSGFDASFLAVETPTAHMHVGWVATFAPDTAGRLPSFSELRDHIELRLGRAPRYRQKLASVPLGLHAPEWIDDPGFSVDRHVYWAPGPLSGLVDEVMSMPLRRDRPLWEIWICEDPDEQRIALVGKAHHCMVDGIAAVELGSLLLDPTSEPVACEPEDWCAEPQPDPVALLARGVRDLIGMQLGLLRWPLCGLASPVRVARETPAGVLRVARALSHSLRPAPASPLNRQLSPRRRMAWAERPLEDLRCVKRACGTTLNDVMLAAVAGGIRAYLIGHGEQPTALKAMVPVSVRDERDVLGNHISFVFAELPCDEPHPLGRLYRVHVTMSARKRDREPEGADLALKAAEHTPTAVQHAISRIFASPRTFNLVVSNIPGPAEPLYMLGCPLQAAYPVVPLADHHALSIGMTTVRDRACFGVYADRETLPDTDRLARNIDDAITELIAAAQTTPNSATHNRTTTTRHGPHDGAGRRRPRAMTLRP
jgi:diacylglycerol O-acyltransferase / wax synthase